jgi:hypothetical protein
MFYMDGDNNLGPGYYDMFQRLEASADNPNVNLLVLWDNTIAGDTAYYEVQYDSDINTLGTYTENKNVWSQGELDMGFPTTLSDFVIWAMNNYPSQRYALVLDNHGSGLAGGLCDGACSNSMMNLPEMQLALATIYEQTDNKIDVLYMAMCLMGMIEDAYQFRDYVDY